VALTGQREYAHARAVQAEHQAKPRWRVLLDPAGHPFCITTVTPDGPPALGPEDAVV
jgi:hypothetical protein